MLLVEQLRSVVGALLPWLNVYVFNFGVKVRDLNPKIGPTSSAIIGGTMTDRHCSALPPGIWTPESKCSTTWGTKGGSTTPTSPSSVLVGSSVKGTEPTGVERENEGAPLPPVSSDPVVTRLDDEGDRTYCHPTSVPPTPLGASVK